MLASPLAGEVESRRKARPGEGGTSVLVGIPLRRPFEPKPRCDGVLHAFRIAHHISVPEPEDGVATVPEPRVAPAVVSVLGVLAAVDLDD
jgi:hypothetical protein